MDQITLTPPPLFAFAAKTQTLNWQAIESADVDQDIIMAGDIEQLERLLANVTMAQLTKSDLKILRDKNLIKLFKLDQVSIEYLLYHERYGSNITKQL